MTPTPRQCRGCGTHIEVPIANQQYCSPQCRPTFKRDMGDQLRRYEENPEYVYGLDKWKRYVAEEGGNVCADCGSLDNLQAHHILPKALGGQNQVKNGVLLCAPCHKARHINAVNPEAYVDRIVERVLERLEAREAA